MPVALLPTSKSQSSMESTKRLALSLEQRIEVIEMAEKGKSQREIAQLFNVGKTQIQSTVKRKAEYLADFEASSPLSKKKKSKATGNEPINFLVLKWFLDATSRKINISGPMIQKQALKFAADLEIPKFSASNGWLQSFIRRNKLAFGKLCDGSDAVNPDVVSSWHKRIPSLVEGYADQDIYSVDETGLFFKISADKSFYIKGQKCGGGEKSKDRITVLICANLRGEKEPLIVIGKSPRPTALDSLDVQQLPATYKNSEKAWMTTEIFNAWLDTFNEKMKCQNRHVILFLDNAPSHPHRHLSNVKLHFILPNTTSVLQPLKQGVVQALKLRYRMAQFRYMLVEMEKDESSTGTEIMKKFPIFNTIFWIASSWKDVKSLTITKCFHKAGIKSPLEIADSSEVEQISIPQEYDELSNSVLGMSFMQLVDIDQQLDVCDLESIDWNSSARTLLSKFGNEDNSGGNDSDDNNAEETATEHTISSQEGFAALSKLRDFLQQRCMMTALWHLEAVAEEMVNARLREKQRPIADFSILKIKTEPE